MRRDLEQSSVVPEIVPVLGANSALHCQTSTALLWRRYHNYRRNKNASLVLEVALEMAVA
jgi:hypothetical protein